MAGPFLRRCGDRRPGGLSAVLGSTARTPSATTSRSPSASIRATGRAPPAARRSRSTGPTPATISTSTSTTPPATRSRAPRRAVRRRSRRSSGTPRAPTTSLSSRSRSRARATAAARASSRRRPRRSIPAGRSRTAALRSPARTRPPRPPRRQRGTRARSSSSSRRTSVARPPSPTLGIDKTGTAFYAASTFDGPAGELAHTLVLRSRDSGLTWQATTPGTQASMRTRRRSIHTCTSTRRQSRLFDIDTLLAGSTDLSFSDDQGNSWLTTLTVDPEVDRPPDADRGCSSGSESRRSAAVADLPEDRLLLRELRRRLRLQPQPRRRDHVHAHRRPGVPGLRLCRGRPVRRLARAHGLRQRGAPVRAEGSLRISVARDLGRRRADVEPRPGLEDDRHRRHPVGRRGRRGGQPLLHVVGRRPPPAVPVGLARPRTDVVDAAR